jgi:hypothetical protein
VSSSDTCKGNASGLQVLFVALTPSLEILLTSIMEKSIIFFVGT